MAAPTTTTNPPYAGVPTATAPPRASSTPYPGEPSDACDPGLLSQALDQNVKTYHPSAKSDAYVTTSFVCIGGYAKAVIDYPDDTTRTNPSVAYFRDDSGHWTIPYDADGSQMLTGSPAPGIPADIQAQLDSRVPNCCKP
jgi:hypothetical protein